MSKQGNSLFDFTDFKFKSDQHQSTNKIFQQSQDFKQNQAILQAIKQLRQKVKEQSRQINGLKDDLNISNIKSRQTQQALQATLTSSIELKSKICQVNTQNQDLKKKVMLLKDTIKSQDNYKDQVNFAKQAILQMKNHTDSLEQQRAKLFEMSLNEKMSFEAEISNLNSKIESSSKYIGELEADYNKSREKIIKLENQIKKININYQQQVFNKHWTTQNFQTQHLIQRIKQQEKQICNLKTKLKKQKQRRVILEDRIVELEEVSGFYNVKSQTVEGEIEIVVSKYEKIEKKYKESKVKYDRVTLQKIEIQQQFNKILLENEQLLTKLKQLNIPQVLTFVKDTENKLKGFAGKKQKVYSQMKNIDFNETKYSSLGFIDNSANKNIGFSLADTGTFQFQSQRRVMQQHNQNVTVQKDKLASKATLRGSNMTFGDRQDRQQGQNVMVENRIRKQREQMQKRIRQKLMQKKMQTSCPSDQFRLRGEYIKNFIDKRY